MISVKIGRLNPFKCRTRVRGVFDKESILMHYYFREAKEFFCVDEVMANKSFSEYIHRNPLLASSSLHAFSFHTESLN